jgi:hypothetical protein
VPGHLAQIPSADLHVAILGQLAPPKFPLGYALKPRPLEIVRLDTPLGGGPLGQEALEHPSRDPDDAVVLADLDPELDGLPVGIPPRILNCRSFASMPGPVSAV